MKKSVNGQIVDMTASEIAEQQAKDAAWEAGKSEREKKEKDKADREKALDGIDHTKPLSAGDLDLVCRAWLAGRKGL